MTAQSTGPFISKGDKITSGSLSGVVHKVERDGVWVGWSLLRAIVFCKFADFMTQDEVSKLKRAVIEKLSSKEGYAEAASLIDEVTLEQQTDAWNVKYALWALTADGEAHFTPGFKHVFLRTEPRCIHGTLYGHCASCE